MSVYLIHLSRKMAHASHYVGEADDVEARIEEHRKTTWQPSDEPGIPGTKIGPGSTFLAACNHYGIDWEVARVFNGQGRTFERKLKKTKNVKHYCPLCNKKPRDYHPKEQP